ncbi:MAG: methyltransferase domain-containing protein [Ardenticatenaceae bacterium]
MMRDNLLLARRVDSPELLDEGGCSEAEARRSLLDLRRLNQMLFGVHATLAPVRALLHEASKPASVLDVGTGSGQMAQELARWALQVHARETVAVRVFALDLLPRHLAYARHWNEKMGTPHVHLIGGSALELPLADQSVDYVISSLFLHHFDEPGLIRLFAECRRVARGGLAMSDLWRHPLPYYLFKIIAEPFLVRSPITRIDGTRSLRRAYRPEEIRRIAGRVLPNVRVTTHVWSMRWVLTSRWET